MERTQKDEKSVLDDIKISEESTSSSSDHEQASQSQKGLWIMLGVIVGVIVLLFVGFSLFNSSSNSAGLTIEDLHRENFAGNLNDDEGYLYNGYSFVFSDNLWWAALSGGSGRVVYTPLHYGPRDVDFIEIEGEIDPAFNQGTDVYLALDPSIVNSYYTLAFSEVAFNVAQGVERRPLGSCTTFDEETCAERPIISCDDSQGKPVIEFALGEGPSVTYVDSCVLITGNDEDIVKAANRFLYEWYRVIE